MKSKALFLDRDGVINKEINYLYRIEDFIFNDGIFELCEKFIKKGYLIIVITNQAGIAKGFYTEKDYTSLTNWMNDEFYKCGITISKVYHCPHHPDITGFCNCRKPNPQMILDAESEFDLDLSESVLIGDKISDIYAGINAKIGLNILISPNNLLTILKI